MVDLIFWHFWARCPKIVLSELGQYLATLEYVTPLKVSQLPRLLYREAPTRMVEANECADAGEVKCLQVVGSAECMGCHGHGVGSLPQEVDLDVLPGGASSLEALAGVRQACSHGC